MSAEKETGIATGFLAALLGSVIMVPLAALQAWSEGHALSILWAWHAVPLGLPALAWPAFAAFMLVVAVVRFKAPRQPDTRDKHDQAFWFVVAWTWSWIMVAAAWVLR